MTTKLNDIIEKTAIDSLKITIPYEKVEIIDQGLLDKKYIINGITFELLQEIKDKSLPKNENGIHTKFSIGEFTTNFKTNERAKQIVILFNSKLLKEDYLKGITDETMPKIYEALINLKVIKFEYEELINAKFTDCDLKIDYLQNEEEYKQELNILYSMIEESNHTKTGGQKHDNGLRANERFTPHYKTKPHILIYSKGKELKSKKEDKKEFTENYLMQTIQVNSKDMDKLRRIEVTIANGKHYKQLTGEENTIKNLLQQIKNEPMKIHENHVQRVFTRIKEKRIMKNLSPRDKADIQMILLLKGKGISEPQILTEILGIYENRTEKNRIKTLFIKKLFNHTAGEKTVIKTINSFLSKLYNVTR